MKKTTDIRERIAVRAYFVWLAGSTASAKTHWLEAEAIETAYAERRAAAATKGAATRLANAMLKPPRGSRPALRVAAGSPPATRTSRAAPRNRRDATRHTRRVSAPGKISITDAA